MAPSAEYTSVFSRQKTHRMKESAEKDSEDAIAVVGGWSAVCAKQLEDVLMPLEGKPR